MKGKKVQVDLAQAVKMWPTPKAIDYKDGKTAGTQDRSSPDLGKVVGQSAISGASEPDVGRVAHGVPSRVDRP